MFLDLIIQFFTNLSNLKCEIKNFIKTYKRKRFSYLKIIVVKKKFSFSKMTFTYHFELLQQDPVLKPYKLE